MKKTLIALAVAASAVVSGSAMAWTANGTGGNVELGGTLTPQEKLTPWEVEIGAKVDGLNAQIAKNSKQAEIPLSAKIPVLGIRTIQPVPFLANGGIAPQIDYDNAVDVGAFDHGRTTFAIDVKDAQQQKIGRLSGSFIAGSEFSWSDGQGGGEKKNTYASQPGTMFWGGIGKNAGAIGDGWAIASSISNEYVAHYDDQGQPLVAPGEDFLTSGALISSFYGAGIDNQPLVLTLDAPVQSDAQIAWTASLPVTVSYQ
ncbi:fimbrial protein [Salmonella enterica]|nr:fimbrial protein [Salmonella enterica]